MTDQEQQFVIETERSMAVLEGTIKTMHDFGGDINLFAFTMLRASSHLFATVHGQQELEKFVSYLVSEETKRRQPTGSA